MPNELPQGYVRFPRTRLRWALVCGFLGFLACFASFALLNTAPDPVISHELASTPANSQSGSKQPQAAAEESSSPLAPVGVAPQQPVAEGPPRPKLPAELGLAATNFRTAVILGRRGGILQGASALRAAPNGQAQLVLLAGDQHPRMRAYAYRELGRRKNPELVTLFRTGLGDQSPYVRENAQWALNLLQGAK